jgi:hypothetical protein
MAAQNNHLLLISEFENSEFRNVAKRLLQMKPSGGSAIVPGQELSLEFGIRTYHSIWNSLMP